MPILSNPETVGELSLNYLFFNIIIIKTISLTTSRYLPNWPEAQRKLIDLYTTLTTLTGGQRHSCLADPARCV